MKAFLFTMFLCIFFSCRKNETGIYDIPNCIHQMIDSHKTDPPLVSVKVQELNGEKHYWLNTGSRLYNGGEFIVNENCNEVCYFGGFILADCLENYPMDKWETVWPR